MVTHRVYRMLVASLYMILKRSALSYRTKKSTLLQESLRKIGNSLSNVPKSEVLDHLPKYCNILRISGHSEQEWYHMIRGALNKHSELQR